MRKLTVLASVVVSLIFSFQVALADQQINFTHISGYQVPQEIGKMIGDARVNIYDYSNKPLGSIVILNGTLNQTSDSLLQNATHNIFVKDTATLQKIFDADSFVKEFNVQRSLHNIDLQALNFFDQIKLLIGTAITALISLFIAPQ